MNLPRPVFPQTAFGRVRWLYFSAPLVLLACFALWYRHAGDRARPEKPLLQGAALDLFPPHPPERPSVRLTSGDPFDGRDGARDAEDDLRAGRYILLHHSTGIDFGWASERAEAWRDHYHVEWRAVDDNYLSDATVKYVEAYNAVVWPRLIERFGPDVRNEVEAKAIALYAQRHPEEARALSPIELPARSPHPPPPTPPPNPRPS